MNKMLRSSLGALLATTLAISAHAQTIITSNTTMAARTGAVPTVGSNTVVNYVIDEGATLTITSTPGWGGARGSIYLSSGGAASGRFTITQGTNGGGSVVFDGGASATSAPNVTSQGGAFLMHNNPNYNVITLIGGTTAFTTGTIKSFWASSNGGVIYMQSGATGGNTFTLRNYVVANNGVGHATSSLTTLSGGVMSLGAQQSQSLFIDNVHFINNQVLGTSSTNVTAQGGVLHSAALTTGTLEFNNVTFDSNSVQATSSGAAATAQGGVIWVNSSRMTLTNATFTNNTAGDAGGAIYANTNSVINITTGTFTANTAQGKHAIGGYGGAIYASSAQLTLTDVAFLNNTATNATSAQTGRGGALYLNNAATTITITASTQDLVSSGNIATGNTGAANAAAGGFAYLAGGSLNLNAATGKTLTIGSATNTTADTLYGVAASSININSDPSSTGDIILHGNSAANLAAINITAGRLLLGNTAAALGGPITAGSATTRATIGGIGAISGNLTINAGSTLLVGLSRAAPQSLTISGTLTLNPGAILDYGLYTGGPEGSSDLLKIAPSGAILQNGAASIEIGEAIFGAYTLIDFANAGAALDITKLRLTSGGILLSTKGYSYLLDNNRLILDFYDYIFANKTVNWSGALSTAWTTGTNNWFYEGMASDFLTADAVEFGDTGVTASARTIAVDPAGVKTVNMLVTGTGAYTFTGGIITTSTDGSELSDVYDGRLIKTGAGALTLANTANNFTGGIEFADGVIHISNAAQLGVTLDNLHFTGTGSQKPALIPTQDITFTGSENHLTVGAPSASACAGAILAPDSVTIAFANNALSTGTGAAIEILPGATLTLAPQNTTGQIIFTSNTAAYGGAIANTGNLDITAATFTGNNSLNAGGAILAQTATTTLTNVTFTSNTAVTGGAISSCDSTLAIKSSTFHGNTTTLDSGAISSNKNLSLDNVAFTANKTVNYGGAILNHGIITGAGNTFTGNESSSLGGAIANDTAGNITLAATTFTGNTAARGGAIHSSGAITLTDALFTGNAATTAGGAIYNAGALTLLATTNAAYTGNAAPDGGFLRAAPGSLTTFDISPAATLTIGAADAADRTLDSIAGEDATATINKTGLGTLTLNAANTAHLGTTNINQGTLLLGNPAAILGGLTNVNAAATLGGIGTITSATINNGGKLMPGFTHNNFAVTAPETLALASLALTQGSILEYDLYTGNRSDRIDIGTLTRSGATTIDLNRPLTGDYRILTATGLSTTATENLITTAGGYAINTTRTALNYTVTANDLFLHIITTNTSITWTGATADWNTAAANWTGGDTKFIAGDRVLFDDTATAFTVAIPISVLAAEMTVANDTNTYTITGPGAITTSTIGTTLGNTSGALTKQGSGLLILANTGANYFENGITIASGTLQADAARLATGAPGITNNATLVFDQATDAAYHNAITGNGSGHLVKTGAAALTLTNAANNYAGGIAVTAGALTLAAPGAATQGALDIAAAATLNITAPASFTINHPLTGPGLLNFNGSTPTSAFNFTSNAGTAFAGTLALANSTYNLSATNAAALANATLALGAGNTTIVGSGIQTLSGLAFDGGKLVFAATIPSDTPGDGVIKVNTLDIKSGLVQINIPPPGSIANNPVAPTGVNILSQDEGNTIASLITASTVTGNVNYMSIVDQNGVPLGNDTTSTVDITESGLTVATGTYAYGLNTTGGLNVSYKLVTIDIKAGQTLHLAPDTAANAAASDLGATINGSGNLAINATNGLNSTVSISGVGSAFTGTALLTAGTLRLDSDNALGAGSLNLAPSTRADLNARSLTLSTLHTAPGSTLDIAGGSLTTSGGAADGTLTGAGLITIAAGNFTINTANDTLTAATTIAPGATATLTNAAALGSGPITLPDPTSTLNLDIDTNGTFSNPLAGQGSLTTRGAGTITITGSNPAYTGATTVNNARLSVASPAALGTGPIVINSTGRLHYSTSGTISNNISGSGTLTFSTGNMTLAGLTTVATIIADNNATLVIAAPGALGDTDTRLTLHNATATLAADDISLGHVTLSGIGRLAFPSNRPATTATIASLDSIGSSTRLEFNTNIKEGTSNTLHITGAITGAYNLAIRNTPGVPADTRVYIPLLTAGSNEATYYLTQDTITLGGMTLYGLELESRENSLTLQVKNINALSDLGAGVIMNATGAMPLNWFSELDTIERRMSDLRLAPRASDGPDLWLRAHARRFEVNDNHILTPYNEDQFGIEAGIDYGSTNDNGGTSYLGAFVGYGKARRNLTDYDADGNTTNAYGGLYLTYFTAGGWYLDFLAKFNSFQNEFDAPSDIERIRGEYNNTAFGASFGTGKRIQFGKEKNLMIVPGLQAAATKISAENYKTSNDLDVRLGSVLSAQVRAGAQLAYRIAKDNGQTLQPYAKVYAAHQWTTGGSVTVEGRPYGSTKIAGSRIDVGLGLNWILGKRLQLYIDYEYTRAQDYTKPYSLSAGLHYAW